MALEDRQILSFVGNELQQSAGGNENDFIDANRQDALATYLGQPDGKEVEGRSSVTSTDVADAIEWIMPEIVKAFTQNNEVVTFDAMFDGDEDQAEMESQFVYDILMKDNEGFIILHQFIKDALMQKNGFIKVFYEREEFKTMESYTHLTPEELDSVLSDEDVELAERTDYQELMQPFSDVRVTRANNQGKISVISVPPEEFRVNKQHHSVSLKDCRFSAHVKLVTAGELVREGHSKELVDSIPSSNVYEDDREYRFYMQDETVTADRNDSLDPALRTIEIAECYMRMDVSESGIDQLMKIEVAGGDNPDVLLSIEEIDENPFISTTAILMSHKLFGLSLYDRLREIQEQKTTLWRNIFDNMYLQNNQRTVVVENQVNLDDLMISRPGGIIRAKRLDAVMPYQTPALPSDAYQMMDYLDTVRAGRAGVTPEGPVTDSMIGDRVGSEGVERMMSQKEELVGLMIRVIAETGIKPLCLMIRGQAIRHQDVLKEYQFRGKWVKVNPSHWSKRSSSTIRVGTGSGNRKEQMAAIVNMITIQKEMLAQPGQALVREQEVYTAMNSFAKFAGMTGASPYFLDPASEEGQQHKQQVEERNQKAQQQEQEMQMMQAKMAQGIAEAEQVKAKAAEASVQAKSQLGKMEIQLDAAELQSDAEIADLKQQLEAARLLVDAKGKDADLAFKYTELAEKMALEREKLETQEEIAEKSQESSSEGE